MKRCPKCNSIWVCWNWIHVDLDRLIQLNPNCPIEELIPEQWGHECWDCESCCNTDNEVKNGLPYWILKHFRFIYEGEEIIMKIIKTKLEKLIRKLGFVYHGRLQLLNRDTIRNNYLLLISYLLILILIILIIK